MPIEAAVKQFKQAQKVDERFKFGDIEDYAKSCLNPVFIEFTE
jgi:hypothetical protein